MRIFLVSFGLFLTGVFSYALDFSLPINGDLEGGKMYINNVERFEVGVSLWGNQSGNLKVHIYNSGNCSQPTGHFILYIRRANGQTTALNPDTTVISSSTGSVAGFADVKGVGDLLITPLSGKVITLEKDGKVSACWVHP